MSFSVRRQGAPLALLLALASAAALAGCSADIATPTNRYAVVIGVQDYPADTADLSFPDDDAIDMRDVLAAQGWSVSTPIISIGATYSAIHDSIATTLANLVGSDRDATVLVYYSGHGSLDNSTGYIIPYDGLVATGTQVETEPGSGVWVEIAGTNPASRAKWITPAMLTAWLDALPCKNKILILDSCYSGNFVITGDSIDASPQDSNTTSGTTEDGLLATAIGNLNELIAASLAGSGSPDVLAISAAGSADLSYETGAVSNGVFTYYLLKAAASGDSNGDGYVTATEAFAYAKSCIKAYWNSVNASSYLAFLPHISGGTGDLVLYVNK